MRSFISVGGFEFEDEADDFIGVLCALCVHVCGFVAWGVCVCKEKE